MIQNKKGTIFFLSFLMLFSNGMNVQTVHAANKTFTLPESTSQTQTQTITLPNVKSINMIATNTGNVSVQSINGNDVTIQLSGGNYSRRVQTGGSAADSKTVTAQTSANYNSDGYTGTLTQYVYSGSYTAAQSKVVSEKKLRLEQEATYTFYSRLESTSEYDFNLGYYRSRVYTNVWTANNPSCISYNIINSCNSSHENTVTYYDNNWSNPSSISYNSDGFTGTLTKKGSWMDYSNGYVGSDSTESIKYSGYIYYGTDSWGGKTVYISYWNPSYEGATKKVRTKQYDNYTGTVTKPASDTRVYRYQGTVSKPDTRTYQNYYQYTVTVDYVDNSAPELTVVNTSVTRSATSGYSTVTLQGTVKDIDNNNVTIGATINGKSKSTVISNTSSTKNWTLTWDVATDNLAEGTYSNIVVNANDGLGGTKSATYTGVVTIDRTSPTVTFTPEMREPLFTDILVQLQLTDAGGS